VSGGLEVLVEVDGSIVINLVRPEPLEAPTLRWTHLPSLPRRVSLHDKTRKLRIPVL
jgi:hypothetical protein